MSVGPLLDIPGGGRGPAEQRSWVCGSLAWQALEAQACRVDIVQACASLGGMAQQIRDRAGLGGMA
jgi:hypothetical protein